MRDGLMRLAGLGAGGLLPQLSAHIDDLRERATADLRQKAVNVGLVIGLALAGAVFALLTVLAALGVLYVVLEQQYDRMTALAVVGASTAVIATIFIIATMYKIGRKASSRSATRASLAQVQAALTTAPASAANAALNSAVTTMRTGSREAVFGTLAAAILLGIIVGRRT